LCLATYVDRAMAGQFAGDQGLACTRTQLQLQPEFA
jgi:hypothetical protein